MASSYKLELVRFSTLLRIQDRAKCGKVGGGHRTENKYTGRGGHHTYIIEVGTLHIHYWGGDTAHSLLGWGHRTTLKGEIEIWSHIAIIVKLGQMLPGQMSLR